MPWKWVVLNLKYWTFQESKNILMFFPEYLGIWYLLLDPILILKDTQRFNWHFLNKASLCLLLIHSGRKRARDCDVKSILFCQWAVGGYIYETFMENRESNCVEICKQVLQESTQFTFQLLKISPSSSQSCYSVMESLSLLSFWLRKQPYKS